MSVNLSRRKKVTPGTILVVGLGSFGSAVAVSLAEQGVDVLAVTSDPEQLEKWADELPHVVELDPTDAEALAQIGVEHIEKAVVALSRVEPSILTVLALAEAGVKEIWARGISREHGAILERIGAQQVIFSEASAGKRVAHAIAGHMVDYFEFEDGFAMARTLAPEFTWGKPLSESVVRREHHVTVVGIKRRGEEFFYAQPETVVQENDELIVSGQIQKVDAFCRLA